MERPQMAIETSNDSSGEPSARKLSPGEIDVRAALERGERRAAVALCARHYGAPIGRLCMSLTGSQSESEDLTQETFLAAYAGLHQWKDSGALKAWLLAIARRKCARHLERRSRHETHLRLVHDVARGELSDEQVLRKERAERARRALDKIRPSEREALLLRFGSELSYRDLAEATGVEEAAARKRVSRAISKLREVLGQQESSR